MQGNFLTECAFPVAFARWFRCVMASPLIAGNDLRTMSPATTKILTNRWAISVNQDKLGKQATLIGHTQGALTQVWAKPLATPAGAWAVALDPVPGAAFEAGLGAHDPGWPTGVLAGAPSEICRCRHREPALRAVLESDGGPHSDAQLPGWTHFSARCGPQTRQDSLARLRHGQTLRR